MPRKCPNCGSTRFKESMSGETKGDKRCQRCGYVNKKLAHIPDDADKFAFYQ